MASMLERTAREFVTTGNQTALQALIKAVRECEPTDQDRRYVAAADRVHGCDGEIEIDEDAIVSRSSDNGAYVQAWVWVDDDQL